MKAEEKRRNIIDKGMDLFNQHGYDRVSVNDICNAVHMTKPTLYRYIPRKEMILVEYYTEQQVDALPKVQKLLEQGRPAAALHQLFTTMHTTALSMGPELFRVYRNYILNDNNYSNDVLNPQLDLLVQCIQPLEEQEWIATRQDPEKLARILMNLNEGLNIVWTSSNGAFVLPERFQRYCRSVLNVRSTEGLGLKPITATYTDN